MKPLLCCIVVLHAAGVLSANLEVASFGRREGAPQQLVDIAADDVHNFDPLALPESSARTAGRIAATSARKPMDAFDSDGIEPIGWKRVISFRQSKRVPPNPGNRQEILKWSKSYYQMRFLKKGNRAVRSRPRACVQPQRMRHCISRTFSNAAISRVRAQPLQPPHLRGACPCVLPPAACTVTQCCAS